jgi:hypothetical protein
VNVRLVLADGTIVTADIESLATVPDRVVGKDERGIDTLVNWRHVIRVYSIDVSPVVLPADTV